MYLCIIRKEKIESRKRLIFWFNCHNFSMKHKMKTQKFRNNGFRGTLKNGYFDPFENGYFNPLSILPIYITYIGTRKTSFFSVHI